jgi:acyl dehydratase
MTVAVPIPLPVLHGAVAPGDSLPELAVDVTPTLVVLGALASRDWRPMHHDYKFATERNGVADIFLNTPNQAAWFERYITDWTGPLGRVGRMTFRMRDSVFPGDRMTFSASVTGTEVDGVGCGWVSLDITLTADSPERGERTSSTCAARVALPTSAVDNPWARHGEDWQP